ncbi:MAG: LysR family transcriptional regulator [Bdellovibrionales bacterium]|nr:LysR family transcriptional regulator [Bdellovibrionales bacterium]
MLKSDNIYAILAYMDVIEAIRIFRRVAQKESFSQVAAEFKVTQPTISKSVASLEQYLGVTLFRRSTRGLSLTSEGQKLLQDSSPLIEQIDAMLSSVKNEKQHLKGQLRITASLAFARLILAPLFNKFSENHPQLQFHFQLSDGYVDLVENNIDLAIRIGNLADSGLKAIKVGMSRRSFYASKSYLKKNGIPKRIDDLRQHKLLFYTWLSDRPTLPLIDEHKKPISFRFEPYLQSDGSDLIRESILEGVGIALLPTWMMIHHESLRIESLQKFVTAASPIYVLSSGSQELNAKQKAFSEYLKSAFQKIKALSLSP